MDREKLMKMAGGAKALEAVSKDSQPVCMHGQRRHPLIDGIYLYVHMVTKCISLYRSELEAKDQFAGASHRRAINAIIWLYMRLKWK